jgi:hypothetical protein
VQWCRGLRVSRVLVKIARVRCVVVGAVSCGLHVCEGGWMGGQCVSECLTVFGDGAGALSTTSVVRVRVLEEGAMRSGISDDPHKLQNAPGRLDIHKGF